MQLSEKSILNKINSYFTGFEKILWLSSVTIIIVTFFVFGCSYYLSLVASIIGATFLILSAKGHPAGQILTIIFSIIYAIISWSFSYYGEVITYLGMTAPMACAAFISWIGHPYNGNKSQVEISTLKKKDIGIMLALTAAVTVGFYFILNAFGTANLLISTLSVTTSFLAVFLTFKRSRFFTLAYAANDVVLIVLWMLATVESSRYLSTLICFMVFLINDIYGFISWTHMKKTQNLNKQDGVC